VRQLQAAIARAEDDLGHQVALQAEIDAENAEITAQHAAAQSFAADLSQGGCLCPIDHRTVTDASPRRTAELETPGRSSGAVRTAVAEARECGVPSMSPLATLSTVRRRAWTGAARDHC
jgi:hypothetical protein